MQRRNFLKAAPCATAGLALTASPEAKAAPRKTDGFERTSFESFHIENARSSFLVEHHTVSCPYEKGSNMWIPISGYREVKDRTVVSIATEEGIIHGVKKPGKVVFQRIPEGADGKIRTFDRGLNPTRECTAREHLLEVAEHVAHFGWMDTPGDSSGPEAWKVVWVEFHCIDGGTEHIIAGLPVHWSSEIPLHVMVQTSVV